MLRVVATGGAVVWWKRGRVLVVVAAVMGLSGCVWPSFRFGSDRTGFNTLETWVNQTNVGTLSPAWSMSTGSSPAQDPVVSGDRVVVAAGQRLVAFDTAGHAAWSVDYGLSPDGTPFRVADPAIAGGAVWVGIAGNGRTGIIGASGELSSVDLATGARQGPVESFGSGSPAVTSQYVYVPFDVSGRSLFGAQPLQGGPPFSSVIGDQIAGLVTVGGGHLFAPAEGGVVEGGYDATGATCPINPQTGARFCSPAWSATVGGSLSTIVYTPDAVFVDSTAGGVYAFNPTNGTPLWHGQTTVGLSSSPAVADGVVYVGSLDGKLYAFAAAGCGATTCPPLWTMATGGPIQSSPSVADGVVYVGSDDGRLYAANTTGCQAVTCAPIWRSPAGSPIRTSPAVAAGTVYVGRTDGTVTAYRPHP